MSTNYLTLRSTVTYVSSGVQPSVGTVYTVGSNGNPAWTSTLVSPVQFSTFLGSSLVTGSVGYSTLTGSTLYGNSGTVSTLTGSTFVTGSVGYSTLTGSTLYGNSGTVSTLSGSTITTGTLGASGPVSIGTRLQASVDGSNNFWISLQGSETEVNRVGIGIGGNPTTGTVSSLSFNAGGSNCMFIHSTGNVGIATTDPQALLDVRGRCYLGVSGNRYVELAADSSNTSYIDFHSQDSRATDYDARIQSLGGTATDGQGSLEFYARNTLIKASTIGTSATATNSNYGLRISQVDTSNSTIGQVIGQIGFEGAGRSVVSGFVRCLTDNFNGYDDAGGLAFGTSEGAGGALERVRINESGLVGIGITNPTYSMLHIANPSLSTLLRLGSSNNPGSYSTILNDVTTMYGIGFSTWQDTSIDKIGAKIMGINRAVYGANPYLVQATDIAFYVNNATGGIGNGTVDSTTEVMRIVAGGNVGIGTTTPSALLHLNGSLITQHGYHSPQGLYTSPSAQTVYFQIGSLSGQSEHWFSSETNGIVGATTILWNASTWNGTANGGVPITITGNSSTLFKNTIQGVYVINTTSAPQNSTSQVWIKVEFTGSGSWLRHSFRSSNIFDHGNGDNGVLITSSSTPTASASFPPSGYTIQQSYPMPSTLGQSVLGLMGQNVGIGTATPQSPLQVVGTCIANTFSAPVGNYLNITNGAGPGQINLQANNILFSNANVGIGTASPGVKLDVHLTETAAWPTGIRILQPNATSGYGPSFAFGRNDACYNVAALSFTYIDDGSQNNYITLGVTCDTTAPFQITGLGRVGIGITNPSYKLHVVGDIYASANVIAMSDQRVKRDLLPLKNSLHGVSALQGYTYLRDGVDGRQMGLIAQEVKDVFPEAVTYDKENDRYGVNYGALIAPLINAIKEARLEYQTRIDQLQQRVEFLEKQLASS